MEGPGRGKEVGKMRERGWKRMERKPNKIDVVSPSSFNSDSTSAKYNILLLPYCPPLPFPQEQEQNQGQVQVQGEKGNTRASKE